MGSLLAPPNEQPQFLQVCFMGGDDLETEKRCQIIQGMEQATVPGIRGPTSFQALKIVDRPEKATFQEACEAMELLEDDGHWDATMEYAMLCRSATTLKELFAIIVPANSPTPGNCGTSIKSALSEDIARRYQGITLANDDISFNEALKVFFSWTHQGHRQNFFNELAVSIVVQRQSGWLRWLLRPPE
ncbi:unnamed protein product [Chilo suppressalis]|uniref:Uncharacterized protein n=1 Tax=Chilo suppressalis TaxID=168631 RepID=A0ABN8B3S6_CHISP|nr:unnamed protein product [Chilo suppressalis]